eukprot:jgi/Ulvmu1/6010/UM026_0136.1
MIADFVVLGGGTAGCAVAARLCENLPGATIVVLERGVPRTPQQELLVRSPLLIKALADPELAETWPTEPNPGFGGRVVGQVAGNTLGGSSAVNGAQWTKPPLATSDFGVWADSFSGLDSTKSAELYARAEQQLQVSQPPPALEQTYVREYLAVAAAFGIPTVDDPLSRTGSLSHRR